MIRPFIRPQRPFVRGGVFGQDASGSWINGDFSGTVYPDSNLNILFTELVNPSTVTTAGDGTGSMELYNDTAGAWVAGAVSTVDNLTFTFNPTADLTGGSSYTIHLSQAILGSATGRPYSGEDFAFTCTGYPAYQSNASFLDDDCTSLTGWTITNGKSGPDTTVVTFDSKNCFKQLNTTAGGTNYTRIKRDVGTFGTGRVTLSAGIYLDLIGLMATVDGVAIFLAGSNTSLIFRADICSDMLEIMYPNATIADTGYNPTQDSWFDWTFDLSFTTGKVDVYVKPYGGQQTKIVNQANFASTSTAWTDGSIDLLLGGFGTASTLVYYDYIKIGNDLVTV